MFMTPINSKLVYLCTNFILMYFQNRLMISLQNDLTFITITQGIVAITTKPETEKYSLIKQFEQLGQYYGMPSMIISNTLIQLSNLEKTQTITNLNLQLVCLLFGILFIKLVWWYPINLHFFVTSFFLRGMVISGLIGLSTISLHNYLNIYID